MAISISLVSAELLPYQGRKLHFQAASADATDSIEIPEISPEALTTVQWFARVTCHNQLPADYNLGIVQCCQFDQPAFRFLTSLGKLVQLAHRYTR